MTKKTIHFIIKNELLPLTLKKFHFIELLALTLKGFGPIESLHYIKNIYGPDNIDKIIISYFVNYCN